MFPFTGVEGFFLKEQKDLENDVHVLAIYIS